MSVVLGVGMREVGVHTITLCGFSLSIIISCLHDNIQSTQSVDAREARILQSQLEQKHRQLEANSQQLHLVSSQMKESKNSLETGLRLEKATRAELEVRLAFVEDELQQANESRERLSADFSSLQGKVGTWMYPILCGMANMA